MFERVAVTGVSGFVGSAVARALRIGGYRVTGIFRGTALTANLIGFDGELSCADVRDVAAMTQVLQNCDALIHCAADYRLWAPDPSEIATNNRTGARATMQAALAAGIRRVVHTSSVATIAPLPGGAADEGRRLTPKEAIGAYKRSKVEAERIVEAMMADKGLPAVIVHPSTPIGPRDVKPTPTGRIIVEAAMGRMPAFVDTGLNLVHVDDVAAGHVAVLERGQVGRHYILGGEDVTLADMLGEIARQVGREAPRVRLPIGPLRPLAWGAEAVAKLTGREPMLTRDALRMAGHKMYFSSARAQAELGYVARDWREGVRDALAWFREKGMVA